MFQKFLAFFLMCYAAAAMSAVDVNKATHTDLTEVKGIGPATATRILDARKQGPFQSWDDMIVRVKGIADTSASKLSAGGLTVNGQTYKPATKTNAPAAITPEKATKPAQSTGKKPEKG
jgi:competence protein ComEA